jgi:Cupin-like domain
MLRSRGAHPNGSSIIEPSSNHAPCCNGAEKCQSPIPFTSNEIRNSRRVKKLKNVSNGAQYGHEWESHLQLCLLMSLFIMAGSYAFFKLAGTSEPIQHYQLFTPKAVYHIPGSMKRIGDKSAQYKLLRQVYEALLPHDPERSVAVTQALHKNTYKAIQVPEDSYYDIHNCPSDPPEGYPYAWNIMDLLKNWPPDDPTPHPDVYQGLCVFDFKTDYDKAKNYRDQEVPFVVRGDPEVAIAVERWNAPGYMEHLMNTVEHRTEYSENNHFLYWMAPNQPAKKQKKKKKVNSHWGNFDIDVPANWSSPTKMMRMQYLEWLKHANVTDEHLGPDKPHWYYRLIGCGDMGDCDRGSSEYLFDELTFFQPKPKKLYMVDYDKQKGIHCRFGMKGVIAENHFDGSRNAIVVLGGERRYILSHPNQCEFLALLPKEHPSGRHSAVDWSNPDLETYPQFAHALTNEVVLQAGDVLYLPTNWFHYIISLDLNFQCNTRSGIGDEYMPPIHECGF